MRVEVARLTEVFLLEPIKFPDGLPELALRIEVFRWPGDRFSCQIWRCETYRLEPSFQTVAPHETFDHEVETLEFAFLYDQQAGSVQEAVEQALEGLRAQLDLPIDFVF